MLSPPGSLPYLGLVHRVPSSTPYEGVHQGGAPLRKDSLDLEGKPLWAGVLEECPHPCWHASAARGQPTCCDGQALTLLAPWAGEEEAGSSSKPPTRKEIRLKHQEMNGGGILPRGYSWVNPEVREGGDIPHPGSSAGVTRSPATPDTISGQGRFGAARRLRDPHGVRRWYQCSREEGQGEVNPFAGHPGGEEAGQGRLPLFLGTEGLG